MTIRYNVIDLPEVKRLLLYHAHGQLFARNVGAVGYPILTLFTTPFWLAWTPICVGTHQLALNTVTRQIQHQKWEQYESGDQQQYLIIHNVKHYSIQTIKPSRLMHLYKVIIPLHTTPCLPETSLNSIFAFDSSILKMPLSAIDGMQMASDVIQARQHRMRTVLSSVGVGSLFSAHSYLIVPQMMQYVDPFYTTVLGIGCIGFTMGVIARFNVRHVTQQYFQQINVQHEKEWFSFIRDPAVRQQVQAICRAKKWTQVHCWINSAFKLCMTGESTYPKWWYSHGRNHYTLNI